eukprot:CAMPEP_0196781556 /NCGR_PEP_ID=MMETSP1104-20130614/9789_1 /TAXON_ID=33652 /ORGANISM="Cafeteria sp., Strain Caron Lab Isolate" /LENGTH=53 /DNA_ID=CAMNT_0042151789 /DNA_START=99 /DNA_END=257 /DNA_ORIENTATION=+
MSKPFRELETAAVLALPLYEAWRYFVDGYYEYCKRTSRRGEDARRYARLGVQM